MELKLNRNGPNFFTSYGAYRSSSNANQHHRRHMCLWNWKELEFTRPQQNLDLQSTALGKVWLYQDKGAVNKAVSFSCLFMMSFFNLFTVYMCENQFQMNKTLFNKIFSEFPKEYYVLCILHPLFKEFDEFGCISKIWHCGAYICKKLFLLFNSCMSMDIFL